ncbi:MAG: MMPL family transporter, partial [Pseudomonadota bacterium]
LNNQIDIDKSSTRIVATLENVTTQELRRLDNAAAAWLGDNLPTGEATAATGPFVLFAYISERNIQAMLGGTLLAFALISVLLGFALRSAKMGFISLVPNLFPAFMAFGVWALAVGEVGLASSVVTATALGIIVDDTVHFLSKYQRARRHEGADATAAVRYAFRTVGTALWVMTVILVAGFCVLALSAFEINRSLGMLTALSLTIALIVDFLLLPPLLIALDNDGKADAPANAQPAPAE